MIADEGVLGEIEIERLAAETTPVSRPVGFASPVAGVRMGGGLSPAANRPDQVTMERPRPDRTKWSPVAPTETAMADSVREMETR